MRKLVFVYFIFFGLTHVAASTQQVNTALDARNKSVVISKNIQRIAALTPALAELVQALDTKDRLIAHAQYSNITGTKSINLGSYTQISAEAVYALKPDVTFASIDGNEASLVNALERLGLSVIVVDTRSLSGLKGSFSLVAKVLGVKSPPPLLIELNQELEQLTKATKNEKQRPKVFLQLGWDPLVTVSKNTFIGELLVLAGLDNVFSESPYTYPKPSAEAVLATNPDLILVCPLLDEAKEGQAAKEHWSKFQQINAVKHKRMYVLPVNTLTKPGPTLVQGIRALRKAIL